MMQMPLNEHQASSETRQQPCEKLHEESYYLQYATLKKARVWDTLPYISRAKEDYCKLLSKMLSNAFDTMLPLLLKFTLGIIFLMLSATDRQVIFCVSIAIVFFTFTHIDC